MDGINEVKNSSEYLEYQEKRNSIPEGFVYEKFSKLPQELQIICIKNGFEPSKTSKKIAWFDVVNALNLEYAVNRKLEKLETDSKRYSKKLCKELANASFVKNFHKQQKITFDAVIQGNIISEKLIYKSPVYNKQQSSSYYISVDDLGNIYYKRKSNHWGTFTTNIYWNDALKRHEKEYEIFKKKNPNKTDKDFLESLDYYTDDHFGRVGLNVFDWKLNNGNEKAKNSQTGYVLLGNVHDIDKRPNIYYQALEFKFIDEIKKNIQKMDKKVSDFQKMKIFEPIKHYFDVIKDVPVKNMTQDIKNKLGLEDNSMGAYNPLDKTIYLNYDAINTSTKTALLHTFIHEAEHARQEKLEIFAYKNIDNPKLSAKEKYQIHLFLMARKRSNDAINALLDYIGSKGFKSTEEFDYIARDLYNKYKKAPMELMADNIAIVMQQAIGDRNDPEVYEFEGTYRGIFEDGTSAINARTGLLQADWATQSIERYNERIATEKRRISDTGILYQSANQNNILFQSAYHGTPHKFDEFSLDAIGTGEGAQAHGWGLYFAENKKYTFRVQ